MVTVSPKAWGLYGALSWAGLRFAMFAWILLWRFACFLLKSQLLEIQLDSFLSWHVNVWVYLVILSAFCVIFPLTSSAGMHAYILCYYNFQFMIMSNLVQKNGISFFKCVCYIILCCTCSLLLICSVPSTLKMKSGERQLDWYGNSNALTFLCFDLM